MPKKQKPKVVKPPTTDGRIYSVTGKQIKRIQVSIGAILRQYPTGKGGAPKKGKSSQKGNTSTVDTSPAAVAKRKAKAEERELRKAMNDVIL
jgi:hypothetical protein